MLPRPAGRPERKISDLNRVISDGTWDRVLVKLGRSGRGWAGRLVDVSADSTIARAHWADPVS